MTLVGIAGLLLGLAAVYMVRLAGSKQRIVIFTLLFVMHGLLSVFNYYVSEAVGSDAHLYYYDTLQRYGSPGLGTNLVINVVQFIKEKFGGTMLDHFMIFQAAGFWGLIFLVKTIDEILDEVEALHSTWVYLPLFLPGVHFWTGAIGKDSLLFLAVSLSVWACLQLTKRLPALAVALAIMLAVRPHIALIALIALALAVLIDSRTKLWVKAGMLAAALAGGAFVVATLDTSYQLNVTSADSVSDFMNSRSGIGEDSGADMTIVQGNMVFKVFSLWLRPMFLDAENMMGYVASLENVALVIMFAMMLLRLGLVRRLFYKVMYIRFSILFFIFLTAMISAVNYNVGLGLRQKMMAMPCLLAILATLIAVGFAQRGRLQQGPVGTQTRAAPTRPAAVRAAQ